MADVIVPYSGEQPSNYRYNFHVLEANALNAYFRLQENDDHVTRSDFFREVYELCYAVADISRNRRPFVDPEIPANDCATYIFERVVITKKLQLVPRGDYAKFPLQHYVRLSMKRYLITPEVTSGFLLNDTEFNKLANSLDYLHNNHDQNIFRQSVAKSVFNDLCVIYTAEEVNRLYPLAREAIINRVRPAKIKIPEIQDFVIVYTTIIRKRFHNTSRIFKANLTNSSVRQIIHTCMSSSFFLSMIMESNIIDDSLLHALDLESIIKLVEIAGGKTITIPVKEKLNSLLVAMNIASDMVISGATYQEALAKIRKDDHIKCTTNPSLHRLVEMALMAIDMDKYDQHSEPTFDTLCSTAKLAAQYAEELACRVEATQNALDNVLLDKFLILTSNVSRITENIIKLQTFIHKKVNKISELEEKYNKAKEEAREIEERAEIISVSSNADISEVNSWSSIGESYTIQESASPETVSNLSHGDNIET